MKDRDRKRTKRRRYQEKMQKASSIRYTEKETGGEDGESERGEEGEGAGRRCKKTKV